MTSPDVTRPRTGLRLPPRPERASSGTIRISCDGGKASLGGCDSTGSLTRAMKTQLELRSASRGASAWAGSDHDGVLRSPPRRLGPGAGTPSRPTPRPLPPPAPEEDEELLRAISARVHPGVALGVLPEVTAPEPELPPTPEHPDPVVSTPPSGIHNTPSRRLKRTRALAEKQNGSSPLRKEALRPPDLRKKGSGNSELQAKPAQVEAPAPTPAESRGLKTPHPDADKKKLRDSLLAEIAQLERDRDLAATENERIRTARLSKRAPSPPTNADEVLDLLVRHLLPQQPDVPKPDPIQDWLALALNPIGLLPFAKPVPQNQQIQPPEEELPLPVSHHPLPMTASEALPYLQVFTPLTFTSHVAPLPPTDNDIPASTPILQKHYITATSTAPRGLFAARIEMTVNTATMAITDLAVPALDLTAEAELRPFIDGITTAKNGPTSSGLHNNISVLTWAMGEWVRVARQRAKVWGALEKEMCAGKEALTEMVGKHREWAKKRGKKTPGKKARRVGRERGADSEDGGDGEDEATSRGGEGSEVGSDYLDGSKHETTADLLPFMGRTSMDLEIPLLDSGRGEVSMLRVQWRILFDWTGEARSDIAVSVGVPGKWHKHDERGRLAGLPKLFDELVQGGEEPLAAVRTVVCLLVGEKV
ncbi:hypothetical protein B0J18DRAFT_435452 [Chaetomium sp. MPI-SDFR-AT-0129]|nr:hypothetical protein B0J18DRAFT_435452 [Chaetomium sp. MPI-SDFR-AT-0129]